MLQWRRYKTEWRWAKILGFCRQKLKLLNIKLDHVVFWLLNITTCYHLYFISFRNVYYILICLSIYSAMNLQFIEFRLVYIFCCPFYLLSYTFLFNVSVVYFCLKCWLCKFINQLIVIITSYKFVIVICQIAIFFFSVTILVNAWQVRYSC